MSAARYNRRVDGSLDFAIGNGWHVTLFHPWLWAVLAAIVLLVVGIVVRSALAR